MRFFLRVLLIIFSCLTVFQDKSGAQSTSDSKNFIILNLGQYAVNEINLGFERTISNKRALEVAAGFIYRNDMLVKQAKDWSNTQYFYEHGFSVRAGYKIFQSSTDGTKHKNYIMPMLNYQYLYFPNEWFETDVKLNDSIEEIYQHRFRNRIGAQFVWGKIFPLNDIIGIEIFYGVGLRAIFTNRFDVAKKYTGPGSETVFAINFGDRSTYFRPSVHAGVKLRIGW